MFHRGQHSTFMRPLDIGRDQIPDLFGILAEGARVDDGIRGIRVHIGVREKIPVNTDGACFFGADAAESLCVVCFAISAKGHGMGKDSGSHQAHGDATFEVCGE